MTPDPVSQPLSPRSMLPGVALALVLAGCGGGTRQASYDYPPQSVLASQRQSWNDSSEVTVSARSEGAPVSRTLASAVGGLFAGPSPAPVAEAVSSPVAKETEKLVIEAWIRMQIDDVAAAAAEIRARVEADGGRVVSENVIGPETAASSAALELRVPPAKAAEFQTWLGSRGLIESRRVLASDVGKTLFDQELALQNLELTMSRLQALAAKDVPMGELIELEKEMTRVRGLIEQLRGEQRWLLDRVAFATVTLTLTREGGPVEFAPHARIHPGAHVTTLTLLDPDGRPRSRLGAGITLHIKRYLTFDLDVFPARGGDTRTVTGTVGSALYSSFLGSGRRRFLNPYLGFRAGLGYLSDEGAGILGGELGLELFKHRYLQIEAVGRTVVFFRDARPDVAFVSQLGFAVPF
jgi:hypothetical protein